MRVLGDDSARRPKYRRDPPITLATGAPDGRRSPRAPGRGRAVGRRRHARSRSIAEPVPFPPWSGTTSAPPRLPGNSKRQSSGCSATLTTIAKASSANVRSHATAPSVAPSDSHSPSRNARLDRRSAMRSATHSIRVGLPGARVLRERPTAVGVAHARHADLGAVVEARCARERHLDERREPDRVESSPHIVRRRGVS